MKRVQDHEEHVSKDAAQNTVSSNAGETGSTQKEQNVRLRIQSESKVRNFLRRIFHIGQNVRLRIQSESKDKKDKIVNIPYWILDISLSIARIIEKLLQIDIVDENSKEILIELNVWIFRVLGLLMFLWTMYKFFF
jgi:hypothetical protein